MISSVSASSQYGLPCCGKTRMPTLWPSRTTRCAAAPTARTAASSRPTNASVRYGCRYFKRTAASVAAIPPWSSASGSRWSVTANRAAPKASTAQHRVKLDQAMSRAALCDGRVRLRMFRGRRQARPRGVQRRVDPARRHLGAAPRRRCPRRSSRACIRASIPFCAGQVSSPPPSPVVAIRTRRGGRGAESERTVTRLSSGADNALKHVPRTSVRAPGEEPPARDGRSAAAGCGRDCAPARSAARTRRAPTSSPAESNR